MKLWKFLIVLGVFGVVAAVLVAGINFLVLPQLVHSNKVVTVPDLRGATPQAAADLMRELDLAVQVQRTGPHARFAAGLITDQVPAPQAGIRAGRTVKVVVSSGPATTVLGDLVGQSERQAGIVLTRDSFQQGRVVRMRRDGIGEPVIAAQSPPAGSKLSRGAVVDLVVADPAPRRTYRMPDLKGVSVERARAAIEKAGLVLARVSSEHSDSDPDGTIIEQRPRPGTRVARGDNVELLAASR